MLKFIKDLLPNIFNIIGLSIEFVAKFIYGLAILFTSIAITLHKLFKTDVGMKLLEIEHAKDNIVKMYNNIAKQVAEGKTSQDKEANKLAEQAKGSNVVQLGSKKNDDTKS